MIAVFVSHHHAPGVHAEEVDPQALGERHPQPPNRGGQERFRLRPRPLRDQPVDERGKTGKGEREPQTVHAPDERALDDVIQRPRSAGDPELEQLSERAEAEQLHEPRKKRMRLRDRRETTREAQRELDPATHRSGDGSEPCPGRQPSVGVATGCTEGAPGAGGAPVRFGSCPALPASA
jgi:hypothetical protein